MPGNQLEQRRSGTGASADAATAGASAPGKQTLAQDASTPQPAEAAAEAATDLAFNMKMAKAYLAKLDAGSTGATEMSDRMELRYYVGKAQEAAARCGADPRYRDALRSMFQLFIDVRPILERPRPSAKPAAAPAPAAAKPAAPAAPPPAAAAAAAIPSPDPLLPLPTTMDELRAKTGAPAPAAAQPGAPADAKTASGALPVGATMTGDHAVVTGMNGEAIQVHIKRGDEQPPRRNPDGTIELYISKDAPPEIAQSQIAKELKKIAETPRQKSGNLDELYGEAAVARGHLKQLCDGIASALGGRAVVPEALKGRERAEEKIRTDYEGENARITDLARASIEFTSFKNLKAALKLIRERAQIVREKDRFKDPADGYRDMMLNVRVANGHIVEVQLHLKAILEAKKEGHDFYEVIRKLDAKAKDENRPLTPEETAQRKRAIEEQKRLYDEAFEASEHGEDEGEGGKVGPEAKKA